MDRAATSSRGGDFYTSDPQSTTSPDPEARGRKRRRDPLTNNNPFSLPRHKHSGESSTLRGRCRHRSASRMHLVMSTMSGSSNSSSSAATITTAAAGGANVVVSPELLSPATENHRRSRSPSRSRSRPGRHHHQIEAAADFTGQRRRQGRRQQRTQSRGRRRHGLQGGLTSVAQTGRPNLGFEEWVTEDGESEKD